MEEFDRKWGNKKKQLFRTFYLFDFLLQWFESSIERKRTWLRRQFHFWERRIGRMHFLLDLGFWHSVEGAWTFFPTPNRFICIPEKDWKDNALWRTKFVPLFLFQYVWFWLSFYFNLFLLHSLLVRPGWGSDKSTHKSSRFFEFRKIIAHKISIDLVLLWRKTFLFRLPRSWIFLVLLPRTPRIFLDFFPRS